MKKNLIVILVLALGLISCGRRRPPKAFYINTLPEGVLLDVFSNTNSRRTSNYYIDIMTPTDIQRYSIPRKYYVYLEDYDTIRHNKNVKEVITGYSDAKEVKYESPKELKNKPIKINK